MKIFHWHFFLYFKKTQHFSIRGHPYSTSSLFWGFCPLPPGSNVIHGWPLTTLFFCICPIHHPGPLYFPFYQFSLISYPNANLQCKVNQTFFKSVLNHRESSHKTIKWESYVKSFILILYMIEYRDIAKNRIMWNL